MSGQPNDEAGGQARPRMDLQKIETWVDQAIQQAQRNGDFDNLPGAGKPLKGLDRPGDPDWWVKGLIEREKLDLSAALPGVMALRREKALLPETLQALPDEAAVRAHVEDFNERVLADRKRPWDGKGAPPIVGRVDVEDAVTRWREDREQSITTELDDAPTGDEEASAQPAPRRRWWSRDRRVP